MDIPNELGILPQLVRINIEGNPLKSIRNNIKNMHTKYNKEIDPVS